MIKAPTKHTLIELLTAFLTFNVFGQTTSLVSIDENGHLTYTPDAKGNIIPDFVSVQQNSELRYPKIKKYI